MNAPPKYALARRSAGPAPLRPPDSVRRTTSIDTRWPEGRSNPYVMTGTARDLVTPAVGAPPVTAASGSFTIIASPEREILTIDTVPRHPRDQEMVGTRAGGASRAALGVLMGDIRGSPLFQLLDDFAGASLVAPWIWSQWLDGRAADRHAAAAKAGPGRSMADICTGFATGSSALSETGQPEHGIQSSAEVDELPNQDDPAGWHLLAAQTRQESRRARRIDLYRDGGLLRVDAGFQDSGSNPRGGRTAVHEYRLYAEIDPETMRLVSIQALPLILPYAECPGASIKIGRLVGGNVAALREDVPAVLAGALGCTHLNDVIRALADVPVLAGLLPECTF